MKKLGITWNLALLVMLCACNEEQPNASMSDEQSREVRFTSTVETAMTRAAGAAWTTGDRIGVYMLKSGETLAQGSLLGEGAYVTNAGDGNFVSATNTPLEYPEDGSAVDFIAYYPYQEDVVSPYIYNINVADQTDPEKIDLLYSENLTGRDLSSPTGNLQFYHQLSTLVLKLKGENLTGVQVEISGLPTKATFALADGTLTVDEASTADIIMYTNADAAEVSAMLIPQMLDGALSLRMTLGGKTKEFQVSIQDNELKAGERYTFTVNVTNTGDISGGDEPITAAYESWFETPLITDAQLNDDNLMYVVHDMPVGWDSSRSTETPRNYSMLYDKTLKFAYWVAYPLFSACLGESGRSNAWDYDPVMSTSFQVNLSKAFEEYPLYDRGHQIPSADRTRTRTLNATTYYYTNMTPQVGQGMNQSIWANLEDAVRDWASGIDTLYVVTGAMPPASNVDYTSKGMAIPEYYFKALARKISGTYRCVAFKLDNKAYSGTDYNQGRMTVDELEELTGFDFFPALEKQGMDESTVDSSWN